MNADHSVDEVEEKQQKNNAKHYSTFASQILMGKDKELIKGSLIPMLKSLALEEDAKNFYDTSQFIHRTYLQTLHTANLSFAVRMLETVVKMTTLSRNPSVTNKRLLEEFAQSFFNDAVLNELLLLFHAKNLPLDAHFFRIFQWAAKREPIFVVRFLAEIDDKNVREHITKTLSAPAKDDLQAILHLIAMNDDDAIAHVKNVIKNYGIASSEALIYKLYQAGDASRRSLVCFALEKCENRAARAVLSRALYDRHDTVRAAALTIIRKKGDRAFAADVAGIVRAKNFKDRSFTERRSTFLALAELLGDEVVDIFRDMLLRRRLAFAKHEKENRLIAVEALVAIGSPIARCALREARSKRFLGRSVKKNLAQTV